MTTPRVIEVRRAGNVVIRLHGAERLTNVPRTQNTRTLDHHTFVSLTNGRKRSIAPQP